MTHYNVNMRTYYLFCVMPDKVVYTVSSLLFSLAAEYDVTYFGDIHYLANYWMHASE